MFTHPRTNETNERGALMLEAIALLGLMTMMSPMVVRQTADRTAELEEVAIAGQMKELRDALNNYIETNYNKWFDELHTGQLNHTYSINAEQLSLYLPSSAIDIEQVNGADTVKFRKNKLADSFDISVRADCIEMRNTNGTDCVPGTCYTITNGVVTSPVLPATGKYCSRYKMSGIILSKTDDEHIEIDDRRAARIASMIGADGGYTRTNQVVEAFGGNAADEKVRILGSQGIWEGNASTYFGNLDNPTGRIAVTTSYSSGISGDYLYRKHVDGLPEANSMFTNLDMGGNGLCNGTGANCNNIHNAGGLEVVGGQILIRSRNNTSGSDMAVGTPSNAFYANIALGVDSSHIKVKDDLAFETGADATTFVHLNNQQKRVELGVKNGASVLTTETMFQAKGGSTTTTLKAHSAKTVLSSDSYSFEMDDTSAGSAFAQLNMGASTAYLDQSTLDMDVGNSTHQLLLSNDEARLSYLNNKGLLQFNDSMSQLLYNNKSAVSLDNEKAKIGFDGKSHAILNGSSIDLKAAGGSQQAQTILTSGAEGKAETIINNTANFSLTEKMFSTALESNRRITFTNDGLKLYKTAPRTGTIDEATYKPSVHLNVESGRVSAGFFQPNKIMLNDGLADPVRNRLRLEINDNDDTGETKVISTAYTGSNAAVDIKMSADVQAPYKFHSAQDNHTYYQRFRVDPAFISVMNDIKLTSRGGARLSEAMPNYILKGIYVLSNSYTAGGWPCVTESGANSCDFKMPYYSAADLNLQTGGFEFNCEAPGLTDHPIRQGGGYCNNVTAQRYVDFSYHKNNSGLEYGDNEYRECPSNSICWAHPFMGKVPAPGRTIVTPISGGTNQVLHAEDEGPCPDGYQAVMTVTPNSFELGKFLTYDEDASSGAVKLNFGYVDYSNSDVRNAISLMQAGTRLGISTEAEFASCTGECAKQILGWKVAMGTVTPTDEGLGYVWNLGGVYTDSWTAIAHTYCYFNPNRFTMPNMRVKKMNTDGTSSDTLDEFNVILTPMENPLWETNAFD